MTGGLVRRAALLLAFACAGCSSPPPPPALLFAGLPVSGDRNLARRFGFTTCREISWINVRCRRRVMVYGQGPYEAAVDLIGHDGVSGFNELTLWHEDDDAVYNVIISLTRQGWHYCYTGSEAAGDQAIFTRKNEPVIISMDISYWGKRRLRIIPQWNKPKLSSPCIPDKDLTRFGADVAKAAAGR